MSQPDYIPQDYHRIKLAESWEDLSRQGYEESENGILYPRTLSENFTALACDLYKIHRDRSDMQKNGVITLSVGTIRGDPDMQQNEEAIRVIYQDMIAMWERPKLRRARLFLVSPESYTDAQVQVKVFHADGSNDDTPWERMMCCYNRAATEIVRNEEAYMKQDCDCRPPLYDVAPDAKIFSFKPGDIWRQRGYYQGSVNPFIHRAPPMLDNKEPRLYLLGDYDL